MKDARKNRGSADPRYRTWVTWNEMKKRCTDPEDEGYPGYGGRGITIHPPWLESFDAFLQDMGPRPQGTTIERIDNDGNYEPGNCTWADAKAQARNRRNNRFVTFRGETLIVTDWAKRLGVHPTTLFVRLERGWPLEEALTLGPCPRGWSPEDAKRGAVQGRKKREPRDHGIDVCPARGCRSHVRGVDPAEVIEGSMFECDAGHVLEAVVNGNQARLIYTKKRVRLGR